MARPARKPEMPSQSKGGRNDSLISMSLALRPPAPALSRSSRGLARYVRRTASLKRRTLEKPAANAISAMGSRVSSISFLAKWTRRVCATSRGDAPRWRRNRRLRWRSPTPSRSARRATSPSSSAPSAISRSARETVAEVPIQAGVPGDALGRQRRQGRKPASWAAAAWGTKRQFSRLGVGAGQIGRQ